MAIGGEFFVENKMVIDEMYKGDIPNLTGKIIHELQHSAGKGEAFAVAMEDCISYMEEEEEEEVEDDDSNRSGGSGGSGSGRIVSKNPHSTHSNVWVIVWIPPSPNGRGSFGEVTVVCDYEPGGPWPDCPDMSAEN